MLCFLITQYSLQCSCHFFGGLQSADVIHKAFFSDSTVNLESRLCFCVLCSQVDNWFFSFERRANCVPQWCKSYSDVITRSRSRLSAIVLNESLDIACLCVIFKLVTYSALSALLRSSPTCLETWGRPSLPWWLDPMPPLLSLSPASR